MNAIRRFLEEVRIRAEVQKIELATYARLRTLLYKEHPSYEDAETAAKTVKEAEHKVAKLMAYGKVDA